MNTEQKGKGRGIWLVPFLLALPFAAVMIYGAWRFGPDLMKLISAAVKAMVVV